jgi:alkylhydroperoxidase/carboxymuconolactone decarboxylase family protein YurZ
MNNIWENKGRIMKINVFSLLIMFLLWIPILTIGSEGNNMEKHHTLSQRQQSIIPIAAFTADGYIDRLKPALSKGLEVGLTVNEIKEILVQIYAYAGFPRSLNGIHAFMEVLDERQAKGIEDKMGKEASPLPADLNKDEYGAKVRAKLAGLDTVSPPAKWQLFSPVIDTFLKEHLFADIFARDVLDHQERELATIAALANMTGTEGQLRFHLGAAMNTGLTQAQMEEFISVLRTTVDKTQAESAQQLLTEVLSSRK